MSQCHHALVCEKLHFPCKFFLYVKKNDFIFSKARRGNKIHHFMLPTLLERKKVFILENKNEVAQFIKTKKKQNSQTTFLNAK